MAIDRGRGISADQIARLINEVSALLGTDIAEDLYPGGVADSIDDAVRGSLGDTRIPTTTANYLPGVPRPWPTPPGRWTPPKVKPVPVDPPYTVLAKKFIGSAAGSYWRLGDTEGPFVDAVGKTPGAASPGGLTRGAPPLVAHSDPSVALDGHGYVDFGDAYDHAGRTPFTVACWIRPSDVAGPYRIAAKHDDDVAGQQGWDISLRDGTLEFHRCNGKVDNAVRLGGIAGGQTVFVLATYDGKVMRLYVNGKVMEAPSEIDLVNHARPLRIGASFDGKMAFKGIVDEAFVVTGVAADEAM